MNAACARLKQKIFFFIAERKCQKMSSKLERQPSFDYLDADEDCEGVGGACGTSSYADAPQMTQPPQEENRVQNDAPPPPPPPADGPPSGSISNAFVVGNSDFKPGKCLNTDKLNANNFFEKAVVLRVSGTLNDFHKWSTASPAEKKNMIAAQLQLSDNSRIFEPVGAKGNRTPMHAQGGIWIEKVCNNFPVSLLLKMNPQLLGSKNMHVGVDSGEQGHLVATAGQSVSYADNPLLVCDTRASGGFTEQYVKNFGKYLSGKDLMKSVQKLDNGEQCLVKIDSPVVDMVNSMRQNNGQPELTPDETAKTIGKIVVSSVEVASAIKELKACLEEEVNFVPLYDALSISLHRAHATSNPDSPWEATDELDEGTKAKDIDQLMNTKYSLTVHAIVEHRPHEEASDA